MPPRRAVAVAPEPRDDTRRGAGGPLLAIAPRIRGGTRWWVRKRLCVPTDGTLSRSFCPAVRAVRCGALRCEPFAGRAAACRGVAPGCNLRDVRAFECAEISGHQLLE